MNPPEDQQRPSAELTLHITLSILRPVNNAVLSITIVSTLCQCPASAILEYKYSQSWPGQNLPLDASRRGEPRDDRAWLAKHTASRQLKPRQTEYPCFLQPMIPSVNVGIQSRHGLTIECRQSSSEMRPGLLPHTEWLEVLVRNAHAHKAALRPRAAKPLLLRVKLAIK